MLNSQEAPFLIFVVGRRRQFRLCILLLHGPNQRDNSRLYLLLQGGQ
jgi:hypothetical protein